MTDRLRRQWDDLIAIHRGLTEFQVVEDSIVISGALSFEAWADGLETFVECFDIEMVVASDFPETLPRVRETAGRIEPDYEHRNPNGTLCLAVPVEQRRILFENPTLLAFVDGLVIPYLYGYAFFKKYGNHPFGEARHGYDGILQHYSDSLDLPDEVAVLAVISFLIEHGYRGHHHCPCGSGLKVRDCHGPVLLELHRAHSKETLRIDFIAIFSSCFEKFKRGECSIPNSLRLQLGRILKRL